MTHAPVHQWRGVVEEYRDWLDIPADTPTITLREGGTPMVDSRWLSDLTGGEVWLKVEGANPTGSFKDRGMTCAVSVAVREGAAFEAPSSAWRAVLPGLGESHGITVSEHEGR